MQYAIIENNTIVNVAEADAPLADNWELLQADAGIGWARTEPGVPFEAPAPAPSPVPPSVTMRQARLALLGAGLLASVDAAIGSLPGRKRLRAAGRPPQNPKKRRDPMKNNALTSDVLELFDSNRITMNSLRKFVVEV